MLSITTVSTGQASSYYTRDDYYTGKDGQETGGTWMGKGAEELRLRDDVKKEDFQRLLDGQDPYSYNHLVGTGGPEHRAGYDMTFSAPKSVSIVSEVLGAERVQAAHDSAVEAVMERFEARHASARETHDGKTETVQTGNIIAAKFDHHTSRAGDPQMHSHVVVINVTHRQDGEWRALEGHSIYEQKMVMGQEYRNELAANLKELNYEIKKDGKGGFEIVGIGKEIRDEFSQRSAQMKDVMDGLREKYPEANEAQLKEMAALSTREAKHELDMDYMRKEWREKLEKMGYDRESLRDSVISQEAKKEPGQSRSAEDYVRLAADIIHEGESAFTIRHLGEIATRLSVGEHRVSDIESAVKILEWKGEIVKLGTTEGKESQEAKEKVTETPEKTPDRNTKAIDREKEESGNTLHDRLKNRESKTHDREDAPENGKEKSGGDEGKNLQQEPSR